MTDNPPAFPIIIGEKLFDGGLSLRDWFAGMVISGMASRDGFDPGQATPEQRARLAYIEADAMLKQRELR